MVVTAHAPSDAPCVEPELPQLTFWCGSWLVTYVDDDGVSWEGSNVVTLVEGGTAIEERFSLVQPGGDLMTGRSLSVPVPGRGWCQTWVDNAGSYLDFVGGWNGQEMVLERATTRDGVDLSQRMIFYDITAETLTWDWQSSADSGRTWRLDWRLTYRRQTQ